MATLVKKIPFNWKQRSALEGRGFHVDIGAFSTPIRGGGAGDVLDQDRPEGCISVPTGTTILPLRITAQCLLPLVATDNDEAEILVAVDILAVNVPHATAPTSETALKMFMGVGTSLCTCTSAHTANSTMPTLGMELARAHTNAEIVSGVNTFWNRLELLYAPKVLPVLVGPCALYLYWGGTVATYGFAQVEWLEFLTTDL